MYLCLTVCMYVCVYLYIYIYIYQSKSIFIYVSLSISKEGSWGVDQAGKEQEGLTFRYLTEVKKLEIHPQEASVGYEGREKEPNF